MVGARFAEDAFHAGVAVLHVGGGVAGHGEHLVVAKDVVAGAVVGEVGVFDRADADPLGDRAPIFLGEERFGAGIVVVADDLVGAFDGFIERLARPMWCRCGS